MSATETKPIHDVAVKSMIDMAVESWRFSRLFIRMMNKLDATDQARYASQLNYFIEKVSDSLQQLDMQLVNIEGQLYDPGIAASPINIADFEATDHLLVDQMLEPIIMSAEGLVRSGRITLRKAQLV
jgi:hypothetical protein